MRDPGPAVAVAASLLFAAAAAHAGATLELTGAPTSTNSMSARVLGRGAATAYFNPAMLADTHPTTEAGYFVLITHTSIELLPRPAGVDVPQSIYNAQLGGPGGSSTRLTLRPLPTSELVNPRENTLVRGTTSYAALGVVRPLFGDRLVFGFYTLLPLNSFLEQQGFFSDERSQYFTDKLHYELLGDRKTMTTFAVAIGSRLNDWLAIGGGADISIGTRTNMAVYVPDAADQREVLLGPNIHTGTSAAPYFSVLTQPTERLQLTMVVHMATSIATDGQNDLRFWNYTYPAGQNSIKQIYHFSQGYEPLRVAIGGVYSSRRHSLGKNWQIGVQALLTRWSQYRDRHDEKPLDAWHDTISPTLGAALDMRGQRLSADLGYVPSPVPDQNGRTNYVDSNRIVASLAFDTPTSVLGASFGMGFYLSGQLLLKRSVTKSPNAANPVIDEVPDNATDIVKNQPLPGAKGLQTNNPGYPGWSAQGWMLGGGVAFRLPR